MSIKPDCAWTIDKLGEVSLNGVRVMSTFASGGGSSMGYKLAGCDVIAANDIDSDMQWHYEKNLYPARFFLCPIKELIDADLPSELFDLDILDGSPPCSSFSTSGTREKSWGKNKHFREGQAEQVLDDLFFDYLDLVERLQPKVVIAENVKGMLIGNAKGYTRLIMARFRELGYSPQVFLVNSADCGVPQRRKRVFFCARRNDIEAPPLEINPQHRWISAAEAIADLQELTESEKKETLLNREMDVTWWIRTKPGDSYSKTIERFGGKSKYWSHVKLSPNKPSNTLTAEDQFKHWSSRRKFTFREWKRFGSFPDDYIAKSDKIGRYIVGMSVPPKMTEAVARRVCQQWLGVEQ